MPYIKQDMRDQLKDGIAGIIKTLPFGILEEDLFAALDYVVYGISKGFLGSEMKYAKINDVIGALECCKMEFLRRQEDIAYNGEEIDRRFLPNISNQEEVDKAIQKLVSDAEKIEGFEKNRAGILNYLLTRVSLELAKFSYVIDGFMVAETMGLIKVSLYETLAAPYEDEKIKENGDVFWV